MLYLNGWHINISELFKKADYYYENHLTYWGLKKLVSEFEINDYTKEIIKKPQKYFATEMVKENSLTSIFLPD